MPAFAVRHLKRPGSTGWIAPAGGALAGLGVAALFLLMSQATLEDWVWRSGLPAMIAVAEPPLGGTARAVLALGVGTLAAAVTWSALFLLFGADGLFAPKSVAAEGVPVLRRADAHPDAPARRPMSAADLGTPMPPPSMPATDTTLLPIMASSSPPPPPVERSIPADLDLPLAAFHPGALPDVPREPVRPVAPLRAPIALDAGERIAAVELPPAATEAPSIESLLRRLERGTRPRVRA